MAPAPVTPATAPPRQTRDDQLVAVFDRAVTALNRHATKRARNEGDGTIWTPQAVAEATTLLESYFFKGVRPPRVAFTILSDVRFGFCLALVGANELSDENPLPDNVAERTPGKQSRWWPHVAKRARTFLAPRQPVNQDEFAPAS